MDELAAARHAPVEHYGISVMSIDIHGSQI